jgi:HK97 family phage major capsid protein
MPNTQQLREQRANVWSQMQEVMDLAAKEGRSLTAEERQKYDAAEADMDRIGGEIDLAERHEARAKEMSRVDRSGVVDEGKPEGRRRETGEGEDGDDPAYRQAFLRYVRGGISELSGDEVRTLRTGWVEDKEMRALGTVSQAAGGYTVPPLFQNRIMEAVQFVAPMRSYATVISTDTGANLPWLTADETAVEGRIIGENTAVTETDTVFGTASIGAYTYSSDMTRVPFQLLQDTGIDLEAYLARLLGNRVGRIQNRHFTVGTGTSQPQGIVTGAQVAKVGAGGQTTTITYDDLVDLSDSLDPALAGAGNLRWMLHQQARKVVRKLKDTAGRPLWEPSLQVGQPDTLLGYGIVLNNNVPVPAASAKSVLFGDFSEAYLIRDVKGFAVQRLNERYAEFGQVAFLGFARADGKVQNTAAVKAYQHPAA